MNIPWMWSDPFDLNLQLTGYVTIMTTWFQGKDIREGIALF